MGVLSQATTDAASPRQPRIQRERQTDCTAALVSRIGGSMTNVAGRVRRVLPGRGMGRALQGGVSPAFLMVEAASDDARNRSSASPAAGCRAPAVTAPANENPGWSSAGIGPT